MSLYEELLECVIDDDSEVIRESVLNKAGLNKEDLRDPEKVKKALKNLNGITSEYEKRSAIINIISSVIQTINALISITGKFSTEGKIAQALSILVVMILLQPSRPLALKLVQTLRASKRRVVCIDLSTRFV